ncbi:MAG: polysaccharide export protein [Lachnospiraceae bacterium]|nr:polysaccharide export protein [Lachnospiraceae bacterium]
MNQNERRFNNQMDDVIDLYELLLNIKKHWINIAAVMLVFAIISGVYTTYFVNPLYKSTSKIYILTNSETIISVSDLQIGSALAYDYEELIKSRPVQEKVIKNLNLQMSYGQLLSRVTITNPEKTRMVTITVEYEDPVVAMKIANEMAEVSREKIAAIMKIEKPEIVEEAIMAKSPSSPSLSKNVIMAMMLGAILSVGVILILQMLDNTVYTPEDVEKYIGLNTLAVIPDSDENRKKKKKYKKKSNDKTNNKNK